MSAIVRVVPAPTEEEQVARLKAQRAHTVERINNAVHQQHHVRSPEEINEWRNTERSLRIDLEMIDGDLEHFATPKDERYAEVRAQMRYEDEHCEVVSDGSTDWESLK